MKTKYIIHICFIILFLATKQMVFAQDVLYFNNGEKKQVIVVEITNEEVKYKNFSNPDGPVYSTPKMVVALLVYSNGTSTTFSSAQTVKDDYVSSSPPEPQVINYPDNLFAINVWDFVYTSIGGSYERFFSKGYFSVRAPFVYNFNPETFTFEFSNGGYNSFSSASDLSPFSHYASYMVGLELNYYPFAQGPRRYFAGVGLNYGEFKYNLIQSYYIQNPGSQYATYAYTLDKLIGNHISFYINNGLMMQLTSNFTLSLVGGLGFTKESTRVVSYTSPTFVFSANMGFRF